MTTSRFARYLRKPERKEKPASDRYKEIINCQERFIPTLPKNGTKEQDWLVGRIKFRISIMNRYMMLLETTKTCHISDLTLADFVSKQLSHLFRLINKTQSEPDETAKELNTLITNYLLFEKVRIFSRLSKEDQIAVLAQDDSSDCMFDFDTTESDSVETPTTDEPLSEEDHAEEQQEVAIKPKTSQHQLFQQPKQLSVKERADLYEQKTQHTL